MTTTQETIDAIGAQQKASSWQARQDAAQRQQAEEQAQRVERYRSQRIAQIKAALEGMPARRKHAEMQAAEADELASILSSQVDNMANAYALKVHGERQGGRPVRLDLGSPEAQSYFFGGQIKKALRQLALTANQRNFGAPLIDAESFAAELKAEEQRLRSELAELQLTA